MPYHCPNCGEMRQNMSIVDIVHMQQPPNETRIGNHSGIPMGVVVDKEEGSIIYPAAWIPTLLVAITMIACLVISFVRYHRKLMVKRHAQSEYIKYCVTARPDVNFRKKSPRIGSIRAGSSFSKQPSYDVTPDMPTSSPTQSISKHENQLPLLAEHDPTEDSVVFVHRLPPLPHKTQRNSANKQQAYISSRQDNALPIENETSQSSVKEKRESFKNSKKKKRKFLRYHSEDSMRLKEVPKQYRASERHIEEETYQHPPKQIQYYSASLGGEPLKFSMTNSAPNISSDNNPFYAEDDEYRSGQRYRSNSYYEECGLPIPKPPKRKKLLKSNENVKKNKKPLAYDQLILREAPKNVFPELTHRDSQGNLTGKLARSLPQLEEAYHKNVDKKSASDEALVLRISEDEPRSLAHQYEYDLAVNSSSTELYPSNSGSFEYGNSDKKRGQLLARAQSQDMWVTNC